ncbi:flagellar basal body-associated FliL family protein [Pseudotabrizicola sp.]|uniref:flagellar basal body-associated FliL family protein n=1 Tax=Pseudotabrizicola sp. TaxID=2939647 RepID=UPI00272088B0|nr:flagellar basal body-associated FliL family protein [Pseudotabrizicola sp.]MDO8885265.1 flagellar basal body-associated FliL family protein [Pseudotabrizicola sp.]
MRKLIPILLILLGIGAGLGAGLFLRPAPIIPVEDESSTDGNSTAAQNTPSAETLTEFVKISNQFIIPVVEKGRIVSLVILSLSLEVTSGSTELVFAQEPKLRDGFLQLLFDHANTGGFRGSFTDADNIVILKRGLKEVAKRVLGEAARNVLITDMVRQDS